MSPIAVDGQVEMTTGGDASGRILYGVPHMPAVMQATPGIDHIELVLAFHELVVED